MNSLKNTYYSLDSLCSNEGIAAQALCSQIAENENLVPTKASLLDAFHGCSETTAFSAEAVKSIGTCGFIIRH